MDRYFEANRRLWDGWTDLHWRSPFYDVDAFRAGASTLKAVELAELGDVRDRAILHLQCHFGLDSLSLARLGARVTGVDFSPRAIERAQELARECSLDAEFLCHNVYDLPAALDGRFDIVFASYGVLAWLPDLEAWTAIVRRALRPGGTFVLVEFHPMAFMLDDTGTRLEYPYFPTREPLTFVARGSYAVRDTDFAHQAHEWPHALFDVVSAVTNAGLRLERVREYPFSTYGCFPFVTERSPDEWRMATGTVDVPLMFSLRATYEATQ
jgi:SAM-dependent methyltransferase